MLDNAFYKPKNNYINEFNQINLPLLEKIDDFESNYNSNLEKILEETDIKEYINSYFYNNKPKKLTINSFRNDDYNEFVKRDDLELFKYLKMLDPQDKYDELLELIYNIMITFIILNNIKFTDNEKKLEVNTSFFPVFTNIISKRFTVLEFIIQYYQFVNDNHPILTYSIPQYISYKNELTSRLQSNIIFQLEDNITEYFKQKYGYFYDYLSNSIIVNIAGTDSMHKDMIERNLDAKLTMLYVGDGDANESDDNFILMHQGFSMFARNIFSKIGVSYTNCPSDEISKCIPLLSIDNHHIEINNKAFIESQMTKLRQIYNDNLPSNRGLEYTTPLLDFYNSVKASLQSSLQDQLKITFIGHSLGSATAEALLLLFYTSKYYTSIRNIFHFVGFCSPRLYHKYTYKILKKILRPIENNLLSIIHHLDLVPKVPNSSLYIENIYNVIDLKKNVMKLGTGLVLKEFYKREYITERNADAILSVLSSSSSSSTIHVSDNIGIMCYKIITSSNKNITGIELNDTAYLHGAKLLILNSNDINDVEASYLDNEILTIKYDTSELLKDIQNVISHTPNLLYHKLDNIIPIFFQVLFNENIRTFKFNEVDDNLDKKKDELDNDIIISQPIIYETLLNSLRGGGIFKDFNCDDFDNYKKIVQGINSIIDTVIKYISPEVLKLFKKSILTSTEILIIIQNLNDIFKKTELDNYASKIFQYYKKYFFNDTIGN